VSELIAALASRTGIDAETARKGLGAVLNFLKGHLSPEQFDQLQTAVPEAPDMLSACEPDAGGSGQGLLGSVAGLAGKLLGGKAGEGAGLLATLSGLGLDAGQIQAFLTQAFELLRQYLPAELAERIQSLIPAAATPAESGAE
jgi:hypothetical protein